ncbi:unnamed protein product, partial [Musa acuminata var. zebrina]
PTLDLDLVPLLFVRSAGLLRTYPDGFFTPVRHLILASLTSTRSSFSES